MAMELDHSFTVPVPPDQAWDVLLDVQRIAPCMPGATVDTVDGDDVAGRLKVKVGPVALTYKGTATFKDRDSSDRSLLVEAAGKELRGAGTATATVRAALQPDNVPDATLVTLHTTLSVTGRPAQFGRGVIAEVGSRLIDKFADNLAQQLSGGADGAVGRLLLTGRLLLMGRLLLRGRRRRSPRRWRRPRCRPPHPAATTRRRPPRSRRPRGLPPCTRCPLLPRRRFRPRMRSR